ncbi:MAG: DUF2975 domain-containing protein [Flavobacterium sp.]
MLNVLYVLAWIIFIGLGIEAGGFLFNTFYTLFINPVGSFSFWNHIDLDSLYQYNQSHFVTLTSLISIIAVLKAILFYLIIKIIHDKKLNLAQPFNKDVNRFIFSVAYLTLGIALFAIWGTRFSENMVQQGVTIPSVQHLKIAGGDVWLFMGITLLVIAQIFKRGIEIQEENDLTV